MQCPGTQALLCVGLSDTLIEQAEVFMGNLTEIVTIITDVKPDDATLDMGSLTVCFRLH